MGTLAWQGIQLDIPSRWSPVKLEGDWRRGYLLLADLLRPRLGLRWNSPPKRKLAPEVLVRNAMLEEVGQLAADEARESNVTGYRPGLLYIEPEPPGRDVWLGYSHASGRVIQLSYHAHRREHLLAQSILPTLVDLSAQDPLPWSVFDLSCRIPRDLPLTSQQLNAGDLTLVFGANRRWISVRQIAVAQVALSRRPLDQWLISQQNSQRKHYRRLGLPTEMSLSCASRQLKGFTGTMQRKRRFAVAWQMARQLTTIALHDDMRDRILILQGTDESLLLQAAPTLSWAAEDPAKTVADR